MKRMGSLATAPDRTRRLWGDAVAVFDFLAEGLNARGFDGPLTWAEESLVPFSKELGPTVRANLLLNLGGASASAPRVRCSVVLRSTTIQQLSGPADPWTPSQQLETPSPWSEGAKACLTIALSHLKWCKAPSDVNPSWPLTSDGVSELLRDLDDLMMPMLDRLDSDEALEALLADALVRVPPVWVKSSGPRFAMLAQLLERLRSR